VTVSTKKTNAGVEVDRRMLLIRQLSGRINPRIPFDINHHLSHEYPQIQVVDFFSWGIFRKYEKADLEWFSLFKDKVKHDSV
jgi:hypothetical protein